MIALWSNFANGGELKQRADSLYKQGAFRKAALLYEKVLFKKQDSVSSPLLLLNKARCYKQLRNFKRAANTLSRIKYYQIQDSLEFLIRKESILMPYLEGNAAAAYSAYKEAEINLDTSKLQRLHYLKILVLMQGEKWRKAEKTMKLYAERKGAGINVDSLFRPVTNGNAFKDTGTAKLLSYLIPGSGQMYAGKFWQGVGSLLLNSGTVYLGVNRYMHEYYFATFITGTGMFMRFYFGGVKHTENLVKKANQKKADKFRNIITRLVLELQNK